MSLTHHPRTGFLFLLPALLFTGVFVLFPLLHLFWLSLTDTSLLAQGKFVGLANYAKAMNDTNFWRSLKFTLLYTVFLTPVLMLLGFLCALLTVNNNPMSKGTRAIIFLPVVIGLGSSSLLWVWMFDQQVGIVNRLLMDLHLIDKPVSWFTKVNSAFWAVCFSVTWKVVGFAMILFVAALQSIAPDIEEAAKLDNASYWRRVWAIQLPLTKRTIILASLISAIGSMLAFDQFYIMTGGGPRGQTFTSVYYVYQNSFVFFKLGYGAALSIILGVIIFAASAVQFWLSQQGGEQ